MGSWRGAPYVGNDSKKQLLGKELMTQFPYRNMGTRCNSSLTVFRRHIFRLHKGARNCLLGKRDNSFKLGKVQ